ncbi:hypothetical protein PFICI_08097 [Pestalotiopsis fici W106-1]|uniref:Spindle pole body component n=1 Tax=Pestalotiopsis fici (strain W106-1 / CGMCC3.15140) TaxID=1229662 RepID=W3X352_PESFW|nr:uncharacterized protein PFICI_08097 [Pestalotiopsis fici W106-1]ETS80568.1 hypothetical protein PFICI_08097 [Pestalotiopsis fici W106-1]
MAFAARLSAWTEELIDAIVTQQQQHGPKRRKPLRDSSLQKLRHHNFLRTNQFDVEHQLNGLEERFRVLNRDGLADNLRDNLEKLSTISNKFTPDVLHFLLALADRPFENSKLKDLEALRQPEEDPGLQLSWAEIAREDDWAADRELWRKVDFRDDSSEDELVEDSDASEKSASRSPSSVEAQYRRRPTDLLLSPQEVDLNQVRESQSWRIVTTEALSQPDRTEITELHALREVLFMLRGLSNDLFNADCRPAARCKLPHASWKSFQVVLGTWGEFGRNLHVLRRFTRKDQQSPLLQVFRSAIEQRLQILDSQLAKTEAGIVAIRKDTVVSLLKAAEDLRPCLQPLCVLSQIIDKLEKENYPHPFRYLELLFDRIGIAQLEGDSQLYRALGTIFFECFKVYLRPIRQWMQDGVLLPNDSTFFVVQVRAQLPLSQIWSSQFNLRKSSDGALHAPSFLQPAVDKIFATGRSVVVLKNLGKYEINHDTGTEPSFDFDELVTSGNGDYAPFSDVFSSAFEAWMQSKYHSAAARLRQILFDSCRLRSVLSDLHHIYLMMDGSCVDAFAKPLFNNLDLLNIKWHDRLLLTQTFHDAFRAVVDVDRVVVTTAGDVPQDIISARTTVQECLPVIALTYSMNWPLRIIISEESIAHYQALFTLQLQNRRAISTLHRFRLKMDSSSNLNYEQGLYYRMRSRILWFCNCLKTYLANLIIAPLTSQLRHDLDRSEDIDAMASIHTIFTKRVREAACLSSKLNPIRESMLEIMDLAICLEDARQTEAKRQGKESEEALGASSTPMRSSQNPKYTNAAEDEDSSFLDDQERTTNSSPQKPYVEVLADINKEYDRHLQFVSGGLRGAARAAKDDAASKWDLLAEMLEVGLEHNHNSW